MGGWGNKVAEDAPWRRKRKFKGVRRRVPLQDRRIRTVRQRTAPRGTAAPVSKILAGPPLGPSKWSINVPVWQRTSKRAAYEAYTLPSSCAGRAMPLEASVTMAEVESWGRGELLLLGTGVGRGVGVGAGVEAGTQAHAPSGASRAWRGAEQGT